MPIVRLNAVLGREICSNKRPDFGDKKKKQKSQGKGAKPQSKLSKEYHGKGRRTIEPPSTPSTPRGKQKGHDRSCPYIALREFKRRCLLAIKQERWHDRTAARCHVEQRHPRQPRQAAVDRSAVE